MCYVNVLLVVVVELYHHHHSMSLVMMRLWMVRRTEGGMRYVPLTSIERLRQYSISIFLNFYDKTNSGFN